MEIILYILIFIMGTLFGSFFTLAIYRIPKREDITHTHSYCTKCNHKLAFLDLIPVWSYLFLRGKCRYCKEKIRPRYFILEILSGLTFVAIAYLSNINIINMNMTLIAQSAFLALYLCFLFITAGIDKENRKIEKSVLSYGILISILYIVYLCMVEGASIYRYIIYLIFYILMLVLDSITLRKYEKNSYLNGLIITVITMVIFTGEYATFNTVIFAIVAISIYVLIYKLKNMKNKDKKEDKFVYKNIPVGYYLVIANFITFIYILSYYKFLT